MNRNFIIRQSVEAESIKLAERNRVFSSFCIAGIKKSVENLISCLREAMYPMVFGKGKCESCAKNHCDECEKHDCEGFSMEEHIKSSLANAVDLLLEILNDINPDVGKEKNEEIVSRYISGMNDICGIIETDVRAAYEGDPAAKSEFEIMLAYPAFEAISIYRLAHRLYELNVPLLPRMMTEYAHKTTGIDIHPGATIGKYFFIDHGTGVVIGETCVIKEHVKLYQGVTLGALSFKLDGDGNPVKGIKRHPDIGNNVIIYAGATILGGKTVIGDNSIIGSNVWLTHSVEAGSKIYYTPKE